MMTAHRRPADAVCDLDWE